VTHRLLHQTRYAAYLTCDMPCAWQAMPSIKPPLLLCNHHTITPEIQCCMLCRRKHASEKVTVSSTPAPCHARSCHSCPVSTSKFNSPFKCDATMTTTHQCSSQSIANRGILGMHWPARHLLDFGGHSTAAAHAVTACASQANTVATFLWQTLMSRHQQWLSHGTMGSRL
jgi:hypothetical protein